MNQPLVSVCIPTYNSASFIKLCLDAIKSQTYKNIEIIIVDGYSKDKTLDIAREFEARVFMDKHGLLNARKIGVEKSSGDYILLLDSDQILEPDSISSCVTEALDNKFDMLVLGEDVYKKETLLEHLFQYDRDLIHSVKDFNPYTGVMLPRFYKTNLIRNVFKNIPAQTLKAGGQDHAIVYYEAYLISTKVELIPHIVKHMEPSSLREIIPKFYRWGYTSADARQEKYKDMLDTKEGFRKGMFRKGLIIASIGSITLLLIKGIPYKLGVFKSKYDRKNVR